MTERDKESPTGQISWLESPFPIKGAGGGRLDFDKPFMVQNLVTGRETVISPGLTVAEAIANNVDSLLKLHEGQVLIDLGCGPGLIGKYLEPKLGATGWLCCVDASEAMLSHTSEVLFGKRAKLIHGDIHTVDKLIKEKADAAILSGNVHLLSNKPLAFAAIRDSLKPEGQLVVVAHAYYYKGSISSNVYANMIDELRESESKTGFYPDGLRLPMLSERELNDIIGVLKKTGFSVQAYENDTWSPDTDFVFGFPPEATVKTRLKLLKPERGQTEIESLTQIVLGEVSRGRQAQVYLLCGRKGESYKLASPKTEHPHRRLSFVKVMVKINQ